MGNTSVPDYLKLQVLQTNYRRKYLYIKNEQLIWTFYEIKHISSSHFQENLETVSQM